MGVLEPRSEVIVVVLAARVAIEEHSAMASTCVLHGAHPDEKHLAGPVNLGPTKCSPAAHVGRMPHADTLRGILACLRVRTSVSLECVAGCVRCCRAWVAGCVRCPCVHCQRGLSSGVTALPARGRRAHEHGVGHVGCPSGGAGARARAGEARAGARVVPWRRSHVSGLLQSSPMLCSMPVGSAEGAGCLQACGLREVEVMRRGHEVVCRAHPARAGHAPEGICRERIGGRRGAAGLPSGVER